MDTGNFFGSLPRDLSGEVIEPLLEGQGVRIERIVSRGHGSPAGFWYEQNESEWVLLIQGKARLEFADDEALELNAGDYVDIPAGVRHRVAWTSRKPEALWLTVFYPGDALPARDGQGDRRE